MARSMACGSCRRLLSLVRGRKCRSL
ncbi:MAG: hypothetical protein J0H67_03550 [Rhodospirillales bacterium]|nr:hypothetical protein [Rhodospirillales bacterium]